MNRARTRALMAWGTTLLLAGCNLTVSVVDTDGQKNKGGSVVSTDGNINCPSTCTFNYPGMSQTVTLVAMPFPGYQFAGFNNAAVQCSNGLEDSLARRTCVVTATIPKTITATFKNVSAYDPCPDETIDNCLANPAGDFDGDGIRNDRDACPEDKQNACPAGDPDGDGIRNDTDLCPLQADNSCDQGDQDGDGLANANDACPLDAANQCLANPDGDLDRDGIKNSQDACPQDANNTCPAGDQDKDGVVNADDICPTHPQDLCDAGDTDSDGITDRLDLCLNDATNQCLNNPQGDLDGDGVKNAIDVCPSNNPDSCPAGDLDRDGVNNGTDACPTDAANACPAGDIDADGIINGNDLCPSDPRNQCLANPAGDFDGDGVANGSDVCPSNNPDSCPAGDPDRDGIRNEIDNCPVNANATQSNFDADSQGDACDSDDDNDGSADAQDCRPNDKAVYPGAQEIPDGKDNNCNNTVDEGTELRAPTDLRKVASGCCNTWGEFEWTPTPFNDGYEISMDGYFGGGCVTDHSAVIEGQVGRGRVTAFGLCLGSKYYVKIRARRNGQWSPWSSAIQITL